ncbi:alpha-D-ribose 1-methylphosphonate 5-triphosphate diphosphatase [Microbacteriaceae bacterium K1510]|nr:alpha-D-ribose 1-methylphosphonate 5-triphosphate diphosphatase [Microbacteriaceae bacterium K1510]
MFTNARIVLPDETVYGSLVVDDGMITAIDTGTAAAPDAVDAEGDYLIPGLIDVHSDNLEKHIVPRPNVVWPTTYAVIAHDADVIGVGITTILDAIALSGTSKGFDRAKLCNTMLDGIKDAAAKKALRADHLLHIRCEVTDPEIIARFAAVREDGAIRMVSLMDHSPGQRVFADVQAWRDYRRKGIGATDEMLDAMYEKEVAAHEKYAEPNRAALTVLAKERQLVIASHDDATPDHVAEAAALGGTISEFPTTLEAARHARRHSLGVVMGAPNLVRGGSHIGNVSTEQCAREGLLDMLSSDYMPVSLLHAAFMLTRDPIGYSLPRAMRTVTATPAKVCGLSDRGEIAIGRRADLVRVRDVEGHPIIRDVWRAGERVH